MGLLCVSTILCLCKPEVKNRAWAHTSPCKTDGWVMAWDRKERCWVASFVGAQYMNVVHDWMAA